MTGFFLALLAALLLALAGRDGVRVARLATTLGPATGLFVAIWLGALIASALAAWAGAWLAPQMPRPARGMFVAFALALAAVELLVLKAPRAPAEPTRSAGAILIVLTTSHIPESARLILLALAVDTGEPLLVATGGALGSGVALTVAGMAGKTWEECIPVRWLAVVLAVALMLAALVIGLSVRGLLG